MTPTSRVGLGPVMDTRAMTRSRNGKERTRSISHDNMVSITPP
jgi:hypothetical protein